MNAEIITIVTVGVALAGVILTSARVVRQDNPRIARRGRDTPRTHVALGRADGKIARSDHPPGQGQRGISRPYKKKPALEARALVS